MAKPKIQDPRTAKHQSEVLAAKKRITIQTEAAQTWARENCATQRPAKTMEFARKLDKALATKVSKHLRAQIKRRIDNLEQAEIGELVVDEDGVIHHPSLQSQDGELDANEGPSYSPPKRPRTRQTADSSELGQAAKRVEKSGRSVKERGGAAPVKAGSSDADHLIDDLFAQWSDEEAGGQ